MPTLGTLQPVPALERPDLLGASVAAALAEWPHAGDVGVVAIDPALADTVAMSRSYDVPLTAGANCVVVMGRRDGAERVGACVVRADTRAEVNTVVKRVLDVRKASFLAHQRAVEESTMEHGGITPLGLPRTWRVLVDQAATTIELAVIGSGIRGSKLLVPGSLLALLPGAEVIPGLAVPAS